MLYTLLLKILLWLPETFNMFHRLGGLIITPYRREQNLLYVHIVALREEVQVKYKLKLL